MAAAQRPRNARIEELRHHLAELARSLGRTPTTTELHRFLTEHQVARAELEHLIDSAAPPAGPAPAFAPGPSAAPAPSLPPPSRRPPDTAMPKHKDDLPPGDAYSGDFLGEHEFTDDRWASAPDGIAPHRHPDPAVARAVEDLVDDWHRTGGRLHYDDVVRLASKRSLRAEQLAGMLSELDTIGIEIGGLTRQVTRTSSTDQDRGSESVEPQPGSSDTDRDVLNAYLRQISRYPLIYAADEVRLGRLIQAGLQADQTLVDPRASGDLDPNHLQILTRTSAAGRRAHADLVCANLRLVVSIARLRRFSHRGIDFIDRIQDGNVGLMHAADKFDPTLGFKFSTYATWWIRQNIDRGIADRSRTIRLPVHLHEKVAKVRATKGTMARDLDREPTLDELAQAVGFDVATVQAILDWSRPVHSLDAPLTSGDEMTLTDLLESEADHDLGSDPALCAVSAACREEIDVVLTSLLPVRERDIIVRRMGLHGQGEETLQTIGEQWGVTRERIRQLESRAWAKLREYPHIGLLRDYLVADTRQDPPPVVRLPEPDGDSTKTEDQTRARRGSIRATMTDAVVNPADARHPKMSSRSASEPSSRSAARPASEQPSMPPEHDVAVQLSLFDKYPCVGDRGEENL